MTTLTATETNRIDTLRTNETPVVLEHHTVRYFNRTTAPLDANFRPIHSQVLHTDRTIYRGGIDDAIDWLVTGHDYEPARAARLILRSCEFTLDDEERTGDTGRVFRFMRVADGIAYADEQFRALASITF